MVMPALECQPGFRAQTSPSFGGFSGGFPPDVLPAVRSIARAPRKGWGLGGGRERDAGSMRSLNAGEGRSHPRTPRLPGPEGLAVPGAVPGAVLAGRADAIDYLRKIPNGRRFSVHIPQLQESSPCYRRTRLVSNLSSWDSVWKVGSPSSLDEHHPPCSLRRSCRSKRHKQTATPRGAG
jgi:hypothetical protein